MILKPFTKLFVVIAALLAGWSSVTAQPRLRAEAVVTGDMVRLGDLVEDAGEQAATPLFRAPALGGIGTIRADRIAEAARDLGLASLELRDHAAIVVRRPLRTIAAEEAETAVIQALAAKDAGLATARLQLDGSPVLRIDVDQDDRLSVEISRLDGRTGRFEAQLRAGQTIHRISGIAEANVEVPVVTRAIGRGETVRAGDIDLQRRNRRELPATILLDSRQILGLVARKTLSTGQFVREGDLVRPDLVERNQVVSVDYDTPGLSLSLKGKALASGPDGAAIQVLNLTSRRTLDVVITGPGRVSARLDVKPAQPRM